MGSVNTGGCFCSGTLLIVVAALALVLISVGGPLAGNASAQPNPSASNYPSAPDTPSVPEGSEQEERSTMPETAAPEPEGGEEEQENPTEEQNPDEEQQEEDPETGGAPGGSDMYGEPPEEPDGLQGMVLDWFKAILLFVYTSTIGDLLLKVSEGLQMSILGLPAPAGTIVEMYDGMVTAMRPVILVGILITALLMMLRTSSYDVAYASFSALPKFLGVAMAFSFLPEFMEILSTMTLDISKAFLPSFGRGTDAYVELFSAAVSNMTLGPGVSILNIVFAVLFVFVGFMVLLVAVVKNILFQLLFIAGPFALAGSIIPGVSHLAGSWFRGVLACAAIPILWSLEIGIGSVIVGSPEVIFGEMVGVFQSWAEGIVTMVGAIVVLWIMYKTPFKVMEWAFVSYDGRRGPIRGFAKSVATGLAISGVRMGIKSLVGGAAGGATGAAAGAAAGASVAKTPDTKDAGSGSGASAPRTARSGSGARGGSGAGKGMRQITGQAIEAGSSTAGSREQLGSRQQGSIAGRSEQKALREPQRALPAASAEVEEKFLKREGTSPGMGTPGARSPKKRKQD